MPAPVDRFVRLRADVGFGVGLRGRKASGGVRPSVRGRASDVDPKGEVASGTTGEGDGQPEPELSFPFFWYEPPWHEATPQRCRSVGDLVGGFGILVGALRREMSDAEAGGDGEYAWPRMAVQRCDRLGWSLEDGQTAKVVELRLGMNRDESGGYSYPRPLADRLLGDQQESGAGDATPPSPLVFPPEWESLAQMRSKVLQWRHLCGSAIYVSCDEWHLCDVMAAASVAGADGVIIRYADDPVAAMAWYHQWASTAGDVWRPRVWLAGGQMTAEDAVKCLALGASAIAIDWICDSWLRGDNGPELTLAERAIMNLGGQVTQTAEQRLASDVQRRLGQWTDSVGRVLQSLFVADVSELGLRHLVRP
jgi:hypothetical protein